MVPPGVDATVDSARRYNMIAKLLYNFSSRADGRLFRKRWRWLGTTTASWQSVLTNRIWPNTEISAVLIPWLALATKKPGSLYWSIRKLPITELHRSTCLFPFDGFKEPRWGQPLLWKILSNIWSDEFPSGNTVQTFWIRWKEACDIRAAGKAERFLWKS